MVVRVVYPPFVSCVRFTLTCEINTLTDSVFHSVKVLKKHELCSVVISTCVECHGRCSYGGSETMSMLYTAPCETVWAAD